MNGGVARNNAWKPITSKIEKTCFFSILQKRILSFKGVHPILHLFGKSLKLLSHVPDIIIYDSGGVTQSYV